MALGHLYGQTNRRQWKDVTQSMTEIVFVNSEDLNLPPTLHPSFSHPLNAPLSLSLVNLICELNTDGMRDSQNSVSPISLI